ncbi:MAG: hypothetical protein WCS94_14185 [Verrucomicrobiota bacterium]
MKEIESFMDFERERKAAYKQARVELIIFVSAVLMVGFLLGVAISHL